MPTETGKPGRTEISMLLRGETQAMADWSAQWEWPRVLRQAGTIVLGAGLYGATMGWWRAPEQALFVAIKLPLIVLLTTLGNALLNAMLAPLLGLSLTFRQSLLAVLLSFTVAVAILGAFSPLAAFLVWNVPPMSPEAVRGATYQLIKVTHVALIAFAGVAGNVRLFQLLAQRASSRRVARRVLLAWLMGNLFFGSQLSWILRPFIGAPHLPVEFLRPDIAFQGNFYENLFYALREILFH